MRGSLGSLRWELALLVLAAILGAYGSGWRGWGRGPQLEFDPSGGAGRDLRVVTWNLGGSVTADLKRGGHSLRKENEGGIIAALKVLGADVILLQELQDEQQLAALAQAIDPQAKIGWTRGRTRSLGWIVRGGQWDLDGDATSLRAGAIVRLRHHGGRSLAVAVLHANPWQARERNQEIGKAVVSLHGTAADLRLLAGDLNLDVDPGARKDLFTDSDDLDSQTYAFITLKLEDAGLGGGPTAEPDRRLDYLLYGAEGLELVTCAPWRGQRQDQMDHHPLAADFRLR